MKVSKIILPLVAFLFAIVGAFATANSAADTDYYINASSQCVQSPLACSGGAAECFVNVGGTNFRVYDELNGSTCQNAETRPQ